MASKNKSKPTKSINQFYNIYENISIISYQANCENSYTATNGIKMVMWMVYDIKKNTDSSHTLGICVGHIRMKKKG